MNTQKVLAVGSLLLQYPGDDIVEIAEQIRKGIILLDSDDRADINEFLNWLSDSPIIEKQTHYVNLFDRRRRACLYLSYYLNGDTRRRGMALVRFKELYSAFGFEVSDEELPDFLPTALQFAASGDFEVGMQILSEHYSGIDVLHQALVSAESPYAHITKVLLRHIPKSENADVNTKELITAGVPTELVGLEPFAIAGRGND